MVKALIFLRLHVYERIGLLESVLGRSAASDFPRKEPLNCPQSQELG
jgi:hypothetical protein